MTRIMTIQEAQGRFADLVAEVHRGRGAVMVESDGRPSVVLVSTADYALCQNSRTNVWATCA